MEIVQINWAKMRGPAACCGALPGGLGPPGEV